jgi:hypothetical protein
MGRRLAPPFPVLRINSIIQRNLARTIGSFLILASLHQSTAHSQETKLIDLPIPKLEALENVHSPAPFVTAENFKAEPNPITSATPRVVPRRAGRDSRFALDRPVIVAGLTQGVSELYDGATTKYFLHHCSTCREVDPVSRFLLGPKPAWPGMIAAGSLEVIATTYLHQSMRHSPHRFLRRSAPLVPFLLTAIHLIEGSQNLTLKNRFYCANPNDTLAANVCVPRSPPPK